MTREEILEDWKKRRGLAGAPYPRDKADYVVLTHLTGDGGLRGGILASLMPFADANASVLAQAKEATARVRTVPLLAGLCGTDPLRLMDRLLAEVKSAGFAGVQNFATVGLIDGVFRTNLEETSLGYGKEVEMVRRARQLGLLTLPIVFTPEEAARMAQAGADGVVIHAGLGPPRKPKELSAFLESVAGAARAVRKEILAIAYGSAGEASLDGVQAD